MEAGDEPGDEGQRNAVHDQDEESQREDCQGQRQDDEDGSDHRIDEAQQECGQDERACTGEPDAGKQLISQPQPERGDDEPNEKASHGAEDNRGGAPARPATNRAVIPGRACTPSFASNRIAPLSESRAEEAQASDSPANGPRSAGQPVTIACSGWPNQLALTVSARGARNMILPRNTHSRLTTTDRKSTRLNSSHLVISYAVFCL